MTTRVITANTTTQVFLADQEDLYVAAGVTVSVSDSYAVNTTYSFAQLYIDGAVVADNTPIYIYGGANQFGNLVHVGATGTLVSAGGGTGLYMSGTNNQIVNEGSIRGSGGISTGSHAGGGSQSTIFNSGTIHAVGNGIDRLTSSTTETLLITNVGMIRGASNSFYHSNANAIEQIVNKGEMIGNVSLGGGSDLYDGRLGRLTGTASGGGGEDQLLGGVEEDVFDGGEGNDLLDGGLGADQMTGSAGNDSFFVQNTGDKIIEAVGGGTDTVNSSITLSLVNTNVEKLILTGTGNINGTGGTAANSLTGNSGVNVLAGGGGKDNLTGGAGSDAFFFNTALNATTNVDTISDFNLVGDTIRLENAIFTQILGTGVLTAAQFQKNATGLATQADDRIIYETDTGELYYDANGSAAGGSVLFAILQNTASVTNADFFVV